MTQVTTAKKEFHPGFAAWQANKIQRQEALREELKNGFPRAERIVLEIGCGHGHFLNAYAAAHPNEFCVGIDRLINRIRRSSKKQKNGNQKNVRFICADADDFIACLPEEIRFDRVFVLFPDPWPKKRHYKNRLLTVSFLEKLAKRCVPGADFCFRTDFRPYFEEVAKRVGKHSQWEISSDAGWPFEAPTVFQERAERYDSLIARKIENRTVLQKVQREDDDDLDQNSDEKERISEDKKGIEGLADFSSRAF